MNVFSLATRRREPIVPEVAEAFSEEMSAAFPAATLLDNQGGKVGRMLDALRGEELAVEAHIAERTERLRQVRVLIDAYTGAERTIEAGKLQQAAE